MRIVLITSFLFAACTVGEVGTINNNNPDGGGTDGVAPAVCVNRLTPAGPRHLHTVGGTSNQGQNCIAAQCHLNNARGQDAPGYQFAGTVYVAGTTNPSAGALIRIVSGTLAPLTTYSDEDGNFSLPAGSLSGAFMATTDVTACPTVTPMVTKLVGGAGNPGANSCNLCHTTAAGAQAPPITL